MPDPDELVQKIARQLEIDWQYTEHLEAWDVERIAEIRSAGRRAGCLLGYRVVTAQSDQGAGDGGRVLVIIAVESRPAEADRERMEERSRLLIEQALRSKFSPGEPEQ
jgi:hypothetical protein